MAGRALAFADPEIVKMATEEFVPVAADDWYQRRREDAEGEFFRDVADRGPRKGEDGSTRQGIYCLTASGRLLAYKNAGHAPDVMREVLHQALDSWHALPASETRPGAITVHELPPGDVDRGYTRSPPEGGLILNVYTRALERDAKGGLCPCEGGAGSDAGTATAEDHLWLTKEEWKSMIPARPRQGAMQPLPERIAQRILRFHLVDNTRGEPPHWSPEEVRSCELTLQVESASQGKIRLRLEGRALLATDVDLSRAERGYHVGLLGWIVYDRSRKQVKEFSLAALGEHWGEGRYTRGARPGRSPLAIYMELASGRWPGDLVPPQGMREAAAYLGD